MRGVLVFFFSFFSQFYGTEVFFSEACIKGMGGKGNSDKIGKKCFAVKNILLKAMNHKEAVS